MVFYNHTCMCSDLPPLGGAVGESDRERDFVWGGCADLPEDHLQPGGHGEKERPFAYFHSGVERERPQKVFYSFFFSSKHFNLKDHTARRSA